MATGNMGTVMRVGSDRNGEKHMGFGVRGGLPLKQPLLG